MPLITIVIRGSDKSNIMVFGIGRIQQDLNFFYQNEEIVIVKTFNYLGVIFTKKSVILLKQKKTFS